jgi:ABC-type transport system substrate-binding protein/serine/threonine protein kinase
MIGTKLSNRYEILRELGRGGMGVVYLAYDPVLRRELAVKLITPSLIRPDAEERFRREAHVVAQMDHPSIVGVYDIGEHEGALYLLMPFVKGTNLRHFMVQGSLRLGDIVDIGIQVAEALEYSHSNGVVHRDIKPENILVGRQDEPEGNVRVRITDFGLAITSSFDRLTKTGSVVGTISYLSPEQVRGEEVDGRSDLYSLGTLLYECLAASPPFSGEMQSVLYRITHEIPQPLHEVAQVDEQLELIVMQCLEKDRMKRPQHGREVAEALKRYRSHLRESDRIRAVGSTSATVSTLYRRPVKSEMVGREKEFAELQSRLNAAVAGECQLILIGGEPGTGKTRLLEEIEELAKARKIEVFHGRFVEQNQAFPYQGFCEIIQEYFRTKLKAALSPSDFSDLAPELVSLFPMLKEVDALRTGATSAALATSVPEARKTEDRTLIFELLAASMTRIAAGRPLVLILEDLHSADVSIEALQYIVRRLGPTPTLILATYRTSDVAKRHPIIRMIDSFQGERRFVVIKLEPFLPSEHAAFLEQLIGSSDLEQNFLDRMYEATEGNPFFTRELVRSLLDSGKIVKTVTGSWNLSGETALLSENLPATIQQTVTRRLEQLPEELVDILSVASVIGKEFELRDLIALSGKRDEAEEAIEKLLQARFLEEQRESVGDKFLFSSGVVRDVIYADLSRPKRRVLHRRYAEHLEKRYAGRLERIYPLLVHHYSQGDVPEKVIEYGLQLTRQFVDAFSFPDAVREANRVLQFLERDEGGQQTVKEAETRKLLSLALRGSGNLEEALKQQERAISVLQSTKEPALLVELSLLAAETAWDARKVLEASRLVQTGLDLAKASNDTHKSVRLLLLGARIANLRGEHDKARSYLEQAERLQPKEKESQEEITAGGTLNVALPVEVEQLHPAVLRVDEEAEIAANIFEPLLTTDPEGNLVPCLCEEWEVLAQARSFLFTLRRDVHFHDGRKLTALDIKTALERSIRLSSDDLPAAYQVIYGIKEFLDGTTNHVKGLVVLSEHKLEIDLTDPLPIYPALLASVNTAIALESDTNAHELIGTGPFRIETWEPHRVILQRNEDYRTGKRALLDRIEYAAGLSATKIASGFRSGEFDLARDLLPEDLDEILRDRRLRAGLVETPKKNSYFALFNTASPVGKIPALRHALFGVVRIHDLVRSTMGRFAEPAEGLIPPGIPAHDPGRRRTNIPFEKAKDLLKTSGFELPIRLKASVHPGLLDRFGSLTDSLMRVWAEVGVEVAIQPLNLTSYIETWTKNEGIDLWIGRWNADYDDADDFTFSLFHTTNGRLRSYYSSKELDRLMEEARVETQQSIREKLYRKIENFLMEGSIVLPLFHEVDYRVAGPKVRGLRLRSVAPYVNYTEMGKSEILGRSILRKTEGGIIHVPRSGTLPDLDPVGISTATTAEVLTNVFECLTKETEEARIEPWLAADFKAEPGSRRFSFRLRDDVRFHDGRRLSARDVRYSFERLLADKKTLSHSMLSPIRGAKDIINGSTAELRGFKILSTLEFIIELDEPVSYFPALLAYTPAAIVPEGTKNFTGGWRDGCIGTGPFRVTNFGAGKRVEMEANPFYWRAGYPKADALIFTLDLSTRKSMEGFQKGEFSVASDLSVTEVETLLHEPDFAASYHEVAKMGTGFIAFNTRKYPFSEEKLRHRFVSSINVDELIPKTLRRIGMPAYCLIPPGLLGHQPALRAPAGIVDEPSGQIIEVKMCLSSTYAERFGNLVDQIREDAKRVAFNVEYSESFSNAKPVPGADLTIVGWSGDYPDADTFMQDLLHSTDGLVGYYINSSEIDRLIERGRVENDPEVRDDIYREIQEILTRRALLFPLYHDKAYGFARPEVQGFDLAFSLLRNIPYEKLWIKRG